MSKSRGAAPTRGLRAPTMTDRKSTRLNSSHLGTSYAVFCLIKKLEGKHSMLNRTAKEQLDESIARGPVHIGKAVGFHTSQHAQSLIDDELSRVNHRYQVSHS